ncbi:MAG TPA: hypothetical protein VFG45_00805 [Candidatus Nitrosocosmicus sp.]|uniref:hypothetical protein n=1 Tax=Candidatus Nitrosocosmicus agrestis TaxID=2563600 RepID=UPI00122E6E80|nr:hypothetical protein [Candidatus Nitrosocosmicus sp. SS]KAA2283851.1 hypothetical protein F1Z66_00825 [Candidatus Nitrosocosmicus sp. SS]KAF0870227.1 hypothetical protein E5N71_01540 [Candidatus Nitrosocosmicus sp. SS]MDR4489410.1 hypothetical protein [Candidatus Nitrosocosmicus sp.]HET6588684.1 hypothetical protein [Candidatus Nitrosocosmicus sp.]
MQIRHCAEKSNVDESLLIIDPIQIRHVIVKSAKLSSISGLIDPKSHLNLDYPYHLVKQCIIAEKFEIGSKVEMSEGGFLFAEMDPSNYQHYGKYDYTQNLQNMINAVKKIRDNNPNSLDNSKKDP